MKASSLIRISLLALSAGLAPAAIHAQPVPAAPASATNATPEEPPVEDIIVTGTFMDTGAKSAMKMNVPVLDTPFAVQSYSQSFVQSLETTSVGDLYSYMTGVKKSGLTAYDLALRGFRSSGDDRNAIMVDGLPGLTTRYASPPTIGVERVELVKGPMSVLYGAMQPGGFVNMISKKPEDKPSVLLEARGMTYLSSARSPFDVNSFHIAGDATGPLTDTLLYRVVAEYGDRSLFRDFTGDRSTYIVPSVSWEPTSSTLVTAQFEYRNFRQQFDTGLVAPGNDTSKIGPITTRYNEPENFRSEEGKAVNLSIAQDIGSWKWNTGFRGVDYESRQQDYSPVSVVSKTIGQIVTRRARELETRRKFRYVDTNLSGEFDTGPIRHKMLVGFNAGKDSTDENRIRFVNSSTSNANGICPNDYCFDISLDNPVYGRVPSIDTLPATNPTLANQSSLLFDRSFITTNWAVYLSDLVTLTRWLKVSLSGRTFEEKQKITERRIANTPDQSKTTRRDLLPSVGILLQPRSDLTVYGSYSEAFVSADPSTQDITGKNPFDPVASKQYEIGIKTDKLIKGVTATLAAFQIDQTGLLTSFNCPTGTTIDGVLVTAAGNCFVQVGAAQSKGIEAEANIQLTHRWQLIAGYAYTDAKIVRDRNPAMVGARLANVPRHSANLWTRYDFANGLGLGLGITHTGQREGTLLAPSASGHLNLPAYTIVDAGIYYQIGNLALNLKIGNLFDKRYIESSGAGTSGNLQIAAGAPRNAILSARYRF